MWMNNQKIKVTLPWCPRRTEQRATDAMCVILSTLLGLCVFSVSNDACGGEVEWWCVYWYK